MDSQTESELINYWLMENEHAIAMINDFNRLSQTWDDLYDRDKPVDPAEVNRMMLRALVTIPRNPFYQQNFHDLQPVVEHCLFNWMDSNWLEQFGDNRDLQVSYILRSATTDLLIHVAYLVGGPDWRLKAAADIRKMIYHDNENFIRYRREALEKRNVRRR